MTNKSFFNTLIIGILILIVSFFLGNFLFSLLLIVVAFVTVVIGICSLNDTDRTLAGIGCACFFGGALVSYIGFLICSISFMVGTIIFLLGLGAVGFGCYLIYLVFKPAEQNESVESHKSCVNLEPTINPSNDVPTKLEPIEVCDFNVNAGDFITLDFETTGFSPANDYIIQIGAAKYNNSKQVDAFSSYIKPPIAIPTIVTNITGINDSMVSNAPSINEILPSLMEFLGDCDIVCHNALFDISFLNNALNKAGMQKLHNKVYDTLPMSRKCISSANHKLETLKRFFGLPYGSHDALCDCKTTAYVYLHCINKGGEPVPYVLQESVQEKRDKPYTPTETEEKFYSELKTIFSNNNKDVDPLCYRQTGSYFDICYNRFLIVRCKLNGKLRYILLNMDLENFKLECGNKFDCALGSKAETRNIRVFINDSDELLFLTDILLKKYDRALESYNQYLKYKNYPRGSHGITIDISDYIK